MRTLLLLVTGFALYATATADPEPVASIAGIRDQGRALYARVATLRAQDQEVPARVLIAASTAVSMSTGYSADEIALVARRLAAINAALDLKALDPNLPGSLEISGPAEFEVGSEADIELVFRPARSLEPGAEIIIGAHWLAPGVPQHVDAGGRNYVSIAAGDAVFDRIAVVSEGLPGSLEGRRLLPAFQLVDGSVQADEAIHIRFQRLELPTRAYARYPLPLDLRPGPDQPALSAEPATISLRPGEAAELLVTAPAEVATAESLTVQVRIMDVFGNLATGRMPSLDVLVDGEYRSRIPASEDPTPVAEVRRLPLGTHEIEVRSAGGGLRSTVLVRADASPADIRWLEPHAPTRMSGHLATAPEVRRRFLGLVDSLWIKEHDTVFDATRWQNRIAPGIDGVVRIANLRAGGHTLLLTAGPLGFADPPALGLARGASLSKLPQDVVGIALPEVPADPRLRDPSLIRLVEIQSGAASHEWYGRLLANQGSRIGFVGSGTAHDRGATYARRAGRTAVRVRAGETTLSALAEGRTWVTSGPRIFLDVQTNGYDPGARAPQATNRIIRGEVRGTAPIDRIDLVRNGEVIETRDFSADPLSDTLRISFESNTAPAGGHYDLPRNGREWIGYVRVRQGEVVGVDDANLRQQPGQAAVRNPDDRSRVDFITWTRGMASSFYLQIARGQQPEGAPDTEVEIVLRRGVEDSDQLPLYRDPADIPPVTMAFGLQELRSGAVTREYAVDGYRDKVTVKLVDREVPHRATFEFKDRRVNGEGDYYYIRVHQSDDHRAWSSPTFVGGFDPH